MTTRKLIRRQVESQIKAFVEYCDLYWDLLPTPAQQVYLEHKDIHLFQRTWFHTGCTALKWALKSRELQPNHHEDGGWYLRWIRGRYLRWIRGRLYESAQDQRQAVLEQLRDYQYQHEPLLSQPKFSRLTADTHSTT